MVLVRMVLVRMVLVRMVLVRMVLVEWSRCVFGFCDLTRWKVEGLV